MTKTMANSILLAVMAMGLIACTASLRPSSELALSESAIKDAEAAGAAQYAPLEFRRANEKYAEASAAIEKKHYSVARQKFEEARIDAELAEAKSYADKSAIDMQTIQRKIKSLRQVVKPQ